MYIFTNVSHINGYLQKKDGTVFTSESGSIKSVITDYVSVSENQKFKYIGHAAFETASVCYYNSRKGFIKAEQFDKEGIIIIPSGTAYVRFASYSDTSQDQKLVLYSIGSENVNK